MPNATLHQFNRLSNPEKWAVIEDSGTYLEVFRMDGKTKICLFALFNYYVEVYYNQVNDRLIKAVAFSSYKRLDSFIAGIDLSGIYAYL